ncbi:hypothetical protein [Actinophytocola sp.]|uniref:hypothetical protein n=1 Tax=Actinophytocola sp. TaxID=1872138 RepID=UPI00389AE1E3
MPRLSFEEPRGGPFAKTARMGKHARPEPEPEWPEADPDPHPVPDPEQDAATELFEQFTDEPEEERRPGRDRVVLILRAATIAVAIALVGFIIVLATSGGDEAATNSPTVPKIPTSHDPSATPPATATTSTPPIGAIVAPPVHSQTTEIVPPPVTQPTVPTEDPPPPSPGGNQFVRIGEPCDTQGAYAFTERFEPVVCDAGRHGEPLAWRRMFR